ncbi:MAG TPA: carbon starvation protein A [Phycisphaerae bacterium]|nr:carbon starvation protein A [Phycisphaerae bacterium]
MEFLTANLHNGMVLMIAVLLVLAIAYRYYSAFIAAKVLALDAGRVTPAHAMRDGQNYDATNKWVLFGHHFAAISGAGPLIGPVLAAQYGFLPGLLWILIGVCLAGAVQDFVVLVLSVRRGGKSLAQIAYMEIGPVAGGAATVGIIFVLVIALAGLGKVIVKALGSHTIVYGPGTSFVAAKGLPILPRNEYSNVVVYRIPAGTKIVRPDKTEEELGRQMEIEAHPRDASAPAPVFDPFENMDEQQKVGHHLGERIEIPAEAQADVYLAGSTWGTFTIAMTIPVALFIGYYMTRLRKGRIVEASIVGGILVLGAVWLGGSVDEGGSVLNVFQPYFDLPEWGVAASMAVYGFVASILPVSVLLLPRDYLSSFLKIGTVGLLVVGVILARPTLQAPAINTAFLSGGPVVPGAIFPFVFITIMCGAISGFHALVSSGTTPKMIDKETDARTIGYGAMLLEGLVGIVALIAACSLPSGHYYAMNTDPVKLAGLPAYQHEIAELAKSDLPAPGEKMVEPLSAVETTVGENLRGRTGGGVTLAVGMAKIFDDAARKILGATSSGVEWMEGMMKYWYHFAIMFEALFILTTIDAGTRVGRFLLQETMGKWVHPKLGQTDWWPSAILATGLMVGGWWYFIDSQAMEAIWPMFGIANQMLAVMALAVATVALVRGGKGRYWWVTVVPMCFVVATTGSAAVILVKRYVGQMSGAGWVNAVVSAGLIVAITVCTGLVVVGAVVRTQVREVERVGAGV